MSRSISWKTERLAQEPNSGRDRLTFEPKCQPNYHSESSLFLKPLTERSIAI